MIYIGDSVHGRTRAAWSLTQGPVRPGLATHSLVKIDFERIKIQQTQQTDFKAHQPVGKRPVGWICCPHGAAASSNEWVMF